MLLLQEMRRVNFILYVKKTAYEIVSRDWSSDVCSSDLKNLNGLRGEFTEEKTKYVDFLVKNEALTNEMCIRDSSKTAPSAIVQADRKTFTEYGHKISISPVSYTHLDVYKRQNRSYL